MTGTERIKNALGTVMSEGEANACEVWRGWDPAGQGYGWWYKPFGEIAQPLGVTIAEAIDQIQDWHIQQLQDRDENPLFKMVSDCYGEPHLTTPEHFAANCKELGWDVTLDWHTDGELDWYTDQHGEVVLEQA